MRGILNAALIMLLTGFVLTGSAQTNRSSVYVTNHVTATPSFRRVNGQLYNREKSTLWKVISGECVHAATNGCVVQLFETEVNRTYAPVAGKYNAWGQRINQRVIVANETITKVPTKKVFLKNFYPGITVGGKVDAPAMQVEPVEVRGERLECWDCGTPNVVPVITVRTNR